MAEINKGSLLIIQFDRPYLRWPRLFLSSLRQVSPNTRVFVDTIDLAEDEIRDLEDLYPGLLIQNDFWENNRFGLPIGKVRKADLMAARKAFVLQEVMQKIDAEAYFLLDADLLFRKPIDGLLDTIKGYDAALILRDRVAATHRVASGIVGVRPIAKKLVDRWVEEMQRTEAISGIRPWVFYWDQVTLWNAYLRSPEIKFGQIDEQRFINLRLSPEADIWSAHTASKETWALFFEMTLRGESIPISLPIAADFYLKSQPDMACLIVTKLLEKEPENLEAHLFFAQIQMLTGAYAEALERFERVARRGVSVPHQDRLFGICYLNLGKDELAEAAFLRSIDTESKPISDIQNLIQIYDRRKDEGKSKFWRQRLREIEDEK